jgi:hypothetical protein
VATVAARAPVNQVLASEAHQTECVIKLAIGKQSGI